MKEKPILFSAPMVRAILEGRKTQTRRIIKYIPLLGEPLAWCAAAKAREPGWVSIVGDYRRFSPYGIPGDRLWVRETWMPDGLMQLDPTIRAAYYKSDGKEYVDPGTMTPCKWRPSIHMPRWASRLTLEVTGVRVERVQEISEEDALAEGVQPGGDMRWNPVQAYKALWASIHGPSSWESNPFVWVIEFKRD